MRKNLINQIEKNQEIQFNLDDLIHEVKSKEASNLNNRGITAQLEYLQRAGFSLKEIKEIIGKDDNED